jgi:hypothetical protein
MPRDIAMPSVSPITPPTTAIIVVSRTNCRTMSILVAPIPMTSNHCSLQFEHRAQLSQSRARPRGSAHSSRRPFWRQGHADDSERRNLDIVFGLLELGLTHCARGQLLAALLVDLLHDVAEFRLAIAGPSQLTVPIEFDEEFAFLDKHAGLCESNDD